MSLSPQWLDELRSRVALSGVISRTTRLTKAGHEFKACCPFHNEKSPSFTVNDIKGFYHCFGCGAHGDVIRWMTDQRGMTFMDAVKELAAEAGMEVPAADPRAAKAAEQRDSLHDVMADAQKWFVESLAGPEGEKARAYLATRGFDAHTVARFGFGYAPEGRQALKAALPQFPADKLIEAGLRIAVDDKEPYDRFRGRLMLPIEDARGRVIAFGGRILDKAKTDAPKYLNSPDTPLFDKGRTLYNLHRAGPHSRQTGRLIVVEGYMDVIALAAAGFGESVAPLGTALTERQIEMLWRLVETPILCFDGDAAGQRAAMRALTRALPLLRPGHSIKIVTLPESMDPDDVIKRSGSAGMQALIEDAASLTDYIWLYELNRAPLNTPEEKAGFKARLAAHIDTIQHPEIQKLYQSQLFDQFSKFAYPERNKDKKSRITLESIDSRVKKRRWLGKVEMEVYNNYMHKRLGAAITQGFMLRPSELIKYVESLASVKNLDRRIDIMVDEIAESPPRSHGLFVIDFARYGEKSPSPEEFDWMNFPFAWPEFPDDVAIPSLRSAIRLYTDFSRANEQLQIAQVKYEDLFDKDSEIEQIRLSGVVRSLFDDLRQLATVD